MDIEEKRAYAKETLGIKQAMNMKEETLDARITKAESDLKCDEVVEEIKTPSVKIDITEADKKFFDSIGLELEWLASIANRYNFNRFQYMAKFKAFRCYRDNNHLDWVSVNDLAMLNGKQELTTILLKHQPHSKKEKIIIKLPWSR